MGKPNVVVVNCDPDLVVWLREQARLRERSVSAMVRLFIRQGRRRIEAGEVMPEDLPDRESAA